MNSLAPDSVASSDDLVERFFKKYFPSTNDGQLRVDIMSFKQMEGESFCETWKRFKDILKKCLHYGIPYWMQIETFYNGLNTLDHTLVDASANGAL